MKPAERTPESRTFMQSHLASLVHGDGYVHELRLDAEEHSALRTMIEQQYLARIAEFYPQLREQFAEKGIENYHLLSDLVDHNALWPKDARLLTRESAAAFRNFNFFSKLEEYIGPFEVIDYEGRGYEEYNWRLVRPNAPTDVGPMHKDSWFWDAIDKDARPDKERIKLWLAVICEPGLSGLRVAPKTQGKDFPFEVVNNKPKIQVPDEELDIKLLSTVPGDAIIFNYDLLHGGSVTRGTKTRVSLEMSLYIDKESIRSI